MRSPTSGRSSARRSRAAFVFPFTQNFVDRAVRGDYFNLHFQLDLTIPRLKKGLMLGTHWGQLDQPLVPTPGDPYYFELHTRSVAFPAEAAVDRSRCASAASAAGASARMRHRCPDLCRAWHRGLDRHRPMLGLRAGTDAWCRSWSSARRKVADRC